MRAKHAAAERERRRQAKLKSKSVEQCSRTAARGHAAKDVSHVPCCDRPGCYVARRCSTRNPARYCFDACRLTLARVRDRERKWLGRSIARRLNCSQHTVADALSLEQPPTAARPKRASLLAPYHARIAELIAQHPELSAVRVTEEISKHGYEGEVSLVRRYVRRIRPARGRVYQEALWEPGDAMQVDWGDCGSIRIGQSTRRRELIDDITLDEPDPAAYDHLFQLPDLESP